MIEKLENKLVENFWIQKFVDTEATPWISRGISQTNRIIIPSKEASSFNRITGDQPIAGFTIVLATYSVLLRKYFLNYEGIINSVANLKGINDKKPLVFSNLIYESETLKSYLQKVKKETIEVISYKDYNISELERKLNNKITSFSPFTISFRSSLDGQDTSPFCLNILENENNDIEIYVSYSTDFIHDALAEHFAQNVKKSIVNIEEYLNLSLKDVPILSEEEKQQIFLDFNDTGLFYDKNLTIHQSFEKQVERTPDNIALVFDEKKISYKELNEKSNQLTNYIKEKYSVSEHDFVGVKVDRNEMLPVALIAVLKLGATYVPIDTNYPKERVSYIEKDSDCKLIIDNQKLNQFLEQKNKYSKINIEASRLKSTDLAYVIYTSGTTGNPKGVAITHQNAVALFSWAQKEFDQSNFDVVYASTSHCFDLSIFEMFYTLSVGKKVRILQNAVSIGDYLDIDKKILINTVPSSMRSILEEGYNLANVKVVNLAGEPFPIDLAKRLLTRGIEVRNLYGPSEDTTYSTAYRLVEGKEYKSIPVGKPISNTKAYILNEDLQHIPISGVGKLYLSGSGVANGYLNRKEQTQEKFTEDPFVKGERMYDTGDLAKWLPNGNIEFLGRKDKQIKLRGHRIELGEIESQITCYSDDINQAVVTIKEKGKEKLLVAYVVCDIPLNKIEIRDYLVNNIPSYMIPSHFVEIDKVPLTPNGKINRDVLPEINDNDSIRAEYVAPKSEEEKILVKIWNKTLQLDRVGVTDSFFQMGGHSLMVSKVIKEMHKQLGKSVAYKEFFEAPTITGIVKRLERKEHISILQSPSSESYPLTPSQNRLWILSQLEEGSLAYNMPTAVSIEGEIDFVLFKKSFLQIIDRHEVLRTNFKTNDDGNIRQFIKPSNQLTFDIELIDARAKDNQKKYVDDYLEKLNNIQYNLEEGALLRATLINIEENKHVFFLSMHHIIGDGWSTEVFISEIVQNYNGLINNEKVKLPELPIQYKDYSVWLNTRLEKEEFEESKKYWLEQFEGELPVLELPSFKTRPIVRTYNGQRITNTFSKTFLHKLKTFSKNKDVTLFMTLMAGINTLLFRYTGQSDIILGTPIAGREHSDLENQLGLYLNTLALRTKIDENSSFFDMVMYQKNMLLEAYQHQEYPFDRLVSELNLKHDTSRSALFDVLIVLQNQENLLDLHSKNSVSGLEIKNYNLKRNTSQFDISFIFVEGEELELTIEYNTDIYDLKLIQRLFSHLENLIEKCLNTPNLPIQKVDYINKEEKKELITKFNLTETLNKPNTVIGFFEEQVQKTPDDIAVIFTNKNLTFKEVNDRSNQLAYYLRNVLRVGKESNIGVLLERSEESVIAMVGVMKSGACYVPIDPNYPQKRIDFILDDAKIEIVLLEKNILDNRKVAVKKKVDLNEFDLTIYPTSNLDIVNSLKDKSFIVYTSGSTGNPKGVVQTHRTLSNLIQWDLEGSGIEAGLRYLQYSSFSFDMSLHDCWFILSFGGQLFVLEDELRLDFLKLSSYIVDNKIEVLSFPYAALSSLFTHGDLEKLNSHCIKHIVSSGEQLTINKSLHQFLEINPQVKLHNQYGPSETHVVTYFTMSGADNTIETYAPIGYPISNTDIYILDQGLQPVPIGVNGELYIGGENLAIGYLNLPQETKKKFIESPFKKGQKLYKTGDLSYWRNDGSIIYIGRNDDQVKIRGYRIELSEIEQALLTHSEIKEAVVLVKTIDDKKVICTYFTSDGIIETNELREYLRGHLPQYMIPTYFIELSSLPLTSNGKVDKKSLPSPKSHDLTIEKERVEPKTDIERTMISIWEDVLGKKNLGITDNFFDKGGHSLLMAQVINQTYKKLGSRISFQDFFNTPNVEALSNNLQKETFQPIPKAKIRDEYPLTPIQKRIWVLSQFEGGESAYNMPAAVKMVGDLDHSIFEKAFNKLLSRHEILRTYFKIDGEGEVKQYVKNVDAINFKILKEDFSDNENKNNIVNDFLDEINKRPFNLEKGPLLSSAIIKLKEREFIFFLSIHHIIGDGWSLEVLISEIIKIYNGLRKNNKIDLSSLTIQYKDYAVWLNHQLQDKKYIQAEKYWLTKFEGDLPVLDLPYSRNRPVNQTFNGNEIKSSFSKQFLDQLNNFAQDNDVTLFMVLMTSVNILLNKYTGQNDIIIGTPVAGREHPDLEDQIGVYLNTLPIRTTFKPSDSFSNLLLEQKRNLVEAYEHQSYPFDELVSQLKLPRDVSRSVLFDVMIVLQNHEQLNNINTEKLIDLKVEPYELKNSTSKLDISFKFIEGESLELLLEYNTDIYDEFIVQQMFTHLKNILEKSILNPNTLIKDIDSLPVEEKQLQLENFNSTSREIPSFTTVLDLFKDKALRFSEKIALKDEVHQYTYKELDILSDQIALNLINFCEKNDRSPIALILDRSVQMVAVLLGVLKSGRSYIPLDPTFPEERLRHILIDSKVNMIISDQDFTLLGNDDISVIGLSKIITDSKELKGDITINVNPNDTAYIIYTSGSTGVPKGVEIGHGSLLNFLTSIIEKPGITAQDTLFAVTTYSFDISILEFFAPLISGATVYIASQSILADPIAIIDKLNNLKPSIIQATPSFYQMLFHADWNGGKNLKLLCGGDVLSEALAKELIENSSELWNMYGPTETTIWSSTHKIESFNEATTIGKPINNTSFYILDDFLKPVPLGVKGGIYIGGKGLAKGYYQNQILTKEKFIPSPFIGDDFLYETGDVGKWNQNGEIEFLGRNDHQVKVRGFRIELGDIETQLNQIPTIDEAIVIAKKQQQETFLIAYVISSEENFSANEVITELRRQLPEYMIPYVIIPISEIPLTPNGKVDRKHLTSLEQELKGTSAPFIDPRNETEKKLCLIWEKVLEIEKIGVLDNFFELGGHSLSATKVVTQIFREFRIKVSINDLFQHATLEEQATLVQNILSLHQNKRKEDVEIENFSI